MPLATRVQIESARTRLSNPRPTQVDLARALNELDLPAMLAPHGIASLAEQAETLAAHMSCEPLMMRARLLSAELCRQAGAVADAAALAKEINSWACAAEHAEMTSRSHYLLSRVFRGIGDVVGAVEHGLNAARHASTDVPVWLRAMMTVSLGVSLLDSGSHRSAERRFAQAGELARDCGIAQVELLVLNNIAYSKHVEGRTDEVDALVSQMLALQRSAEPPRFAEVLNTIARHWLAQGDTNAAIDLLQPVADEADAPQLVHPGELSRCLLNLAVALREADRLPEAEVIGQRCLEMATSRHQTKIMALAHEERSRLCAAQGDFREAYEAFSTYHRLWNLLVEERREARVAILYALYDADEAYQARDRAQELARIDPLTAAFNRRYLDDDLPQVIERTAASQQPLSVALIDLDDFKRINDQYSHLVGDGVLQGVAALLHEQLPCGASLVRLGGDEFLLVLPGLAADAAHKLADGARRSVAAHTWRSADCTVTVTVSVGVFTTDARVEISELLAAADRQMYLAKQAGRNRVSSS